jgi:hypothetical protein
MTSLSVMKPAIWFTKYGSPPPPTFPRPTGRVVIPRPHSGRVSGLPCSAPKETSLGAERNQPLQAIGFSEVLLPDGLLSRIGLPGHVVDVEADRADIGATRVVAGQVAEGTADVGILIEGEIGAGNGPHGRDDVLPGPHELQRIAPCVPGVPLRHIEFPAGKADCIDARSFKLSVGVNGSQPGAGHRVRTPRGAGPRSG